MNFDNFKEGFEKTAAPVKNLIKAMMNSFKKPPKSVAAINKIPAPKNPTYSGYLKTKKTLPKSVPSTSSNVLDYNKLRAEMTQKNIASRGSAKRKLSGISGQPVITTESRAPWKS
jgi:hypothetical protein